MPHEREGIHIRGVVVLVAPWHRIAVAAVHDDAARRAAELGVGRRDQPSAFNLAQPGRRVLGKALGGLFALSLQRQVDVVIVDKECAEARPARFPFHSGTPTAALVLLQHNAKSESRWRRKRRWSVLVYRQHKV